VPEIVSPLKVKLPLFTTDQPVPCIVMVPEARVKVFAVLTVKAPVKSKEAVGWVLGVPAIVRL